MSERHVSFDMIVHAVCAVGGVSRLEIMADRRGTQEVVRLRHLCWWLARELTPMSHDTIGHLSRGRHHSTVMSGITAIEVARAESPDFRTETDALRGTLLALERHNLLRVAAVADPLATARRVLAAPEREAVRVPVIEIIALCRLVAETFDEDGASPTDPSEPASTAIEETEHAA